MIGTIEVRCCAAQPQKPLAPVFSFKDSPQSFRILDVPKSIGTWELTRVYVGLNYPDNTNVEKDATRQGNVWVATVEGCPTAGKTMGGFTIYADGTDEEGNPVEGYVLGNGDVYVMDKSEKISALVGKTTMRILEDLPTTASEGDVIIQNDELKIFHDGEWVSISTDLSDYYTKEEIDEKVDEIDSSIGELASSVGVLDSSVSELGASVSALDSSLSILSASVSSLGEDLGVVNASVSSLTSSVTSLASTKRDKTDRVWKYTRTTDPEMYGVQKFYVHNNTSGEAFDLVDFNKQTKTWSVYEGAVSVVAYNSTLLAVIDENNPHQFDDDGETREGWPFYRTNDTTTQWLVEGGDAEYNVIATRRANDTFAFDTKVDEKRDYDDLTWDYPLEQDSDRFGVGNFNVEFNGSMFSLSQFSKTAESRTWSQLDVGTHNRFEIYTSDGRHYNLLDKVDAKTIPFTRTGNDNVVWSIETSDQAYLVRAIRREQGRLAVYEPNLSNSDERYLDFGQSGAGLVLGANLSASAQAFVQIDDVMLTGPNYMSSRGAQMRGAMKKRGDEPHLKVNGEAVAFVNEVEAVGVEVSGIVASVSAMTSQIDLTNSHVSALESRMGEVNASVEALGSSVSDLGSQVTALASSMSGKRDYDDLTYANRSQEAMTRAPTYGIGKIIATPSDGSDPNVMDLFFIHENPSEPENKLGSCWWRSGMYVGTKDGVNFRLVNVSFVEEATFTKTQLLNGEVTFTHGNKEWTLTAVIGDGMIDWWNININGMDWKTTRYSYDSTTHTAKWSPTQPDSWYMTRTYSTSPGQSLDTSWLAKLWRGNDGVHEDGLVASFWIGGQYGYGGGVEKTFTYGDNTSFLKIHLMGYPFQSNLGLAERIPQQVGMLKNDIGYITMDGAERSLKTVWRTWEYELDGLKFTAEEANSTVAMQAVGSAPSVSLEYTTDGSTWNDFIVGETTVTLANVGDKMAIRAKTTNSRMSSASNKYNRFVMTGKVASSDSIMYLLKNDGDLDTIPSAWCFYRVFYGCTSLTTSPELPSTTLTDYCYSNMFMGCTSLTSAPELPATSLMTGCYMQMFDGCSSLTQAIELPATTLATNCYNGMFWACTFLNEIKIGYTGNFSSTYFNNWVVAVASTGTFYYNGSDTTRGASAIPENWSVVQF